MSKIALGKSGRHTVEVDLDILLTTRMLVQAGSGGGKSHLLRLLAEAFYGKVQVFILDPEGEFATLREKFGYVLIGQGGDAPLDVRSAPLLAEKLLELRASAVFDLYEAFRSKPIERKAWVKAFLEAVIDAPKKYWRPLIVIVDEAHKFCPEQLPKAADPKEREIISGCKDAMVALATVGRKRGFCSVWATQRLAKLDKDASSELLNRMVGMTIEDVDVDRAAELMSVSKDERADFKKSLKIMEPGNFYGFGRAISKDRVLLKVGPVKTTHPTPGSAGYGDEPPPPPEKVKALLPKLADLPRLVETKAKNEAELRQEVKSLKAQLAKQPAAKPTIQVKETTKEVIKKVEVPAVSPKDILRLEASMVVAVTAAGKVQDAAAHLRGFVDKLGDQLSKIQQIQRGLTVAPPRPSSSLFMRKAAPVKEKKVLEAVVKTDFSSEPAGDISPRQRKILTALAEFAAIGIKQVARNWVAARSESSPRSSSFANNLSALRTRGLIDYSGGNVHLTDEGHGIVGPSSELTVGQMKESCLKLLTPKQREIFEALYHVYPEISAREDIAGEIGCSPASSSYANNLSSLRSAGMIEKRRDGTEKLSDWVMIGVGQGA